MGFEAIHEREFSPQEIRMQRIVSAAKLLELESREPDPDQFYVLNSKRVFTMTAKELSALTGISETMLYYFLSGRSGFGSLMREHLSKFIRMDPGTIKELAIAAKHERQRRFGKIDGPCQIPPPLFHYFKPFNRIGPSPNTQKFHEMVAARTGVKREGKMPHGTLWFEQKAKQIAEQYGFQPDTDGIYRKPGKG